MNDTAMARLRAADPATGLPDSDPQSPQARALLTQVLDTPAATSNRSRRRVYIGAAVAGVIAAATTVFIVTPAAAYTVDRHDDGTVAVRFDASRLKNPARLNADLADAGARTIVMTMVPADQCTTTPAIDPNFALGDPDAAKFPVSYTARDNGLEITIRPAKMPPGDTLVFGYAIQGHTLTAMPAVVTALPSCLAIPTRLHQ